MVSALAIRVASRGRAPLVRVGGVLLHKAPGREADLVRKYGGSIANFPHYLVGKAVYSFCDEAKRAAHAAWQDEVNGDLERRAYRRGDWRAHFCDTLAGETRIRESPTREHYAWWDARWGAARGLAYASPAAMLAQIAGTEDVLGPNGVYVGVECCDGYSPALLGALVRDVFLRHGFSPPLDGSLPQVWCCTHSDVGPIRRTTADGRPWDPRDGFVDWRALERALNAPREVA